MPGCVGTPRSRLPDHLSARRWKLRGPQSFLWPGDRPCSPRRRATFGHRRSENRRAGHKSRPGTDSARATTMRGLVGFLVGSLRFSLGGRKPSSPRTGYCATLTARRPSSANWDRLARSKESVRVAMARLWKSTGEAPSRRGAQAVRARSRALARHDVDELAGAAIVVGERVGGDTRRRALTARRPHAGAAGRRSRRWSRRASGRRRSRPLREPGLAGGAAARLGQQAPELAAGRGALRSTTFTVYAYCPWVRSIASETHA